ncbi:porin family protein [Myroides odoratimimus]|uniref:porin family protein n=1 Tax=Myroides odoratimimus TaxID=76832 RepID=UPI0026E08186|nr:porin family protein [Myroides odoratimimus]MDO5858965.1 porin family protein [Myroides odoratimimus]
MKKLLLSTLAFIAISTAAVAQHHEEGKTKVSFGVKAGFNQTMVTNIDDIVGKSGFHIGGVVEAKFSKRFALQGELLYTTMGGKLESLDIPWISTVSYDGKVKLNYIAVPVMAKVFITEGFNIQVGPQFNFAVKTEGEINGKTGDIGELVNKFDLGLNAGLGYDFKNNLFIDMRTSFGVIDVFKDVPTSNKNFAFMVGVGYKF